MVRQTPEGALIRTHVAEETELVILPPEAAVIGTRGPLLGPAKNKDGLGPGLGAGPRES